MTSAVDRERGEITHYVMARDLKTSPLTPEIILQALPPVVHDHVDVEASEASVVDLDDSDQETVSAPGTADDVDLVDRNAVSPALAAAIFETGVLLVGEAAHGAERHRQLTASGGEQHSPRKRLSAALDRIDDHLGDGDGEVPATGDEANDG